jgi:hypothetical protein
VPTVFKTLTVETRPTKESLKGKSQLKINIKDGLRGIRVTQTNNQSEKKKAPSYRRATIEL